LETAAGQNEITVEANIKYLGAVVEYLDEGRLRPGLVVREQGTQLAVVEAGGRERSIARDLVLLRHPELKTTRENLAETLTTLADERTRLAAELDLNLLWEIVHEQGRNFSADELAELFFGRRSATATSVMFEALFNDRLYFVRRHMEFIARSPEQVERLRVQYDKVRLRSESSRKTRSLVRGILEQGMRPQPEEVGPLAAELTRYLENPFTRNRELTAILESSVTDITPAEAAYEILERLDAAPLGPRFVVIGGVRTEFSEAAQAEAQSIAPPERQFSDVGYAVTIDDEDTVEIDDAISCEPLADGGLRVRVHIALVADFVPKGGPIDKEAAARGATVYLPEATVRMVPDRLSCDSASLIAGHQKHVLTTEVLLSKTGEILEYSIYPSKVRISARLSYDQADTFIAGTASEADNDAASIVRLAHEAAMKLRERRRASGALLVQRREPKIKVSEGEIEFRLLDTSSPSRELVAELMVLSNHAAARFAAENRIPIIYRVQPGSGDLATLRPRLSLYPEYHAGIGLDYYTQVSSPIRRYMDLVLQRQLLAALSNGASPPYEAEELLAVLATAENVEAEGKELERRARRYWTLRYLELKALNRPLKATVLRDGASAELDDYAVRGSLRGAPHVPSRASILVQIARVEPVHGALALEYLGPTPTTAEGAH
jgi:exoribonuclease II